MTEPTFGNFEFIREWSEDGFKLELFNTNKSEGRGVFIRDVLAYQFYDNGKLIFSGTDYKPSPMFCLDSDNVVYSLLGFLSVKPGTIDKEFFKEYTKQQLDWSRTDRADSLGLLVDEYEEGDDDK